MIKCAWRVEGKVQGVFFRKFTKLKADELGLSGWCQNTADGVSVMGEIAGLEETVNRMVEWLKHEGSPQSFIEKFEVLKWERVDGIKESGFEIRR